MTALPVDVAPLAPLASVAPVGPATADGAPGCDDVAAAAARLLGRPCTPVAVLGRRAVPGGEVLVVALDAAGTPVVAKSAPGALTAPGVAAQTAARDALARYGATALRVPAVLAHDPAAGLVVMERAGGDPLPATPPRHRTAAVRRLGRALAELHAATADPRRAGVRTLADHLRRLVRPQPAALAAYDVRIAADAQDVVTRLLAGEDAAAPAVLAHRDVHPRQVLVDGPVTWLLDWDLAAPADPALDVGNVVGHARTRLAPHAAEAFVTAFLAGYRSAGSGPAGDPATLVRGRRFEAFTYLRLACKTARLDGPAGRDAVARLVARAAATLDDGPVRHG